MEVLRDAEDVMISAGTLAECLIVACHRGKSAEMERLIDGLALQVEPVSHAAALRTAAAHVRWGKGVHPAGLNFGDCFAYAAARSRDAPLLFVGQDFARTDIESALAGPHIG